MTSTRAARLQNGWDDIRPKPQTMLRDRFSVAVHIEQRNLPTYNLVVLREGGRLGPSLMRSPIKDCFDRIERPTAN